MYQGKLLEGVDAMIPRIGASYTLCGSAVVRQFEMMETFKLRCLQIHARKGIEATWQIDVAGKIIDYITKHGAQGAHEDRVGH